MNAMNPRSAVAPGRALRAVVRLAAVLSMVAALGIATAQTADAARAKSNKSKAASTAHKQNVEKVDLNTATEKDLEELPGIGTVMAQKIVAGRPYKSVADLKRAGIPPSTIRALGGKVKASRASAAMSRPAPAPAASKREENPEASTAARSEAPKAGKSAPQRTFFGIPIGGPAKPAPKEAPAPAGAEASGEQPAGSPQAAATERARPEEPPAKGMVWVNLDSKVYHVEGDRWYGATKHGKYMWVDQAIREGYRASKTGPK